MQIRKDPNVCADRHTHTHPYICIHVYIYIYVQKEFTYVDAGIDIGHSHRARTPSWELCLLRLSRFVCLTCSWDPVSLFSNHVTVNINLHLQRQ